MISSGCRNCGHPIRPHFANRSSRITGPCASRGGCSRDNFAHLAPPLSPRHHSAMGQDRKSATAQETFSSADRVASGDERRHVLPKDLPNAVKHLNDEELDRLLVVTLAEAKRRGRHTTPINISKPEPQISSLIDTWATKCGSMRLFKLASLPRGSRGSSAYPNRTLRTALKFDKRE